MSTFCALFSSSFPYCCLDSSAVLSTSPGSGTSQAVARHSSFHQTSQFECLYRFRTLFVFYEALLPSTHRLRFPFTSNFMFPKQFFPDAIFQFTWWTNRHCWYLIVILCVNYGNRSWYNTGVCIRYWKHISLVWYMCSFTYCTSCWIRALIQSFFYRVHIDLIQPISRLCVPGAKLHNRSGQQE